MGRPKITAYPEEGVFVRVEFGDGSRVDLGVDVTGSGPRDSLAYAWANALTYDATRHRAREEEGGPA